MVVVGPLEPRQQVERQLVHLLVPATLLVRRRFHYSGVQRLGGLLRLVVGIDVVVLLVVVRFRRLLPHLVWEDGERVVGVRRQEFDYLYRELQDKVKETKVQGGKNKGGVPVAYPQDTAHRREVVEEPDPRLGHQYGAQ